MKEFEKRLEKLEEHAARMSRRKRYDMGEVWERVFNEAAPECLRKVALGEEFFRQLELTYGE